MLAIAAGPAGGQPTPFAKGVQARESVCVCEENKNLIPLIGRVECGILFSHLCSLFTAWCVCVCVLCDRTVSFRFPLHFFKLFPALRGRCHFFFRGCLPRDVEFFPMCMLAFSLSRAGGPASLYPHIIYRTFPWEDAEVKFLKM